MGEPGFSPIEVEDESLNSKKDPRWSDPKELLDIISRASERDSSAKEELISKFEWLIESNITRYFDEYRDSYYDDLMQEGKLAILKFLEDFDSENSGDPNPLINTAIYWRLNRFVRKNQPISTGKKFEEIRKYELTKDKSPESSNDSIRNKMGISKSDFESIKEASEVLETFQNLNIDKTEGAEDPNKKWQRSIDDILADRELAEKLSVAIDACSTPKQARAAKLRFGFIDGKPRSISEVARILEISKAAVGQYSSIAIRKTRGYLQLEIDQQPTEEPAEERAIPEKTTSERRLEIVERIIEGDDAAKEEFIKEFQADIQHIIKLIFYFLEDSYSDQLKQEAESALFKTLENVKKDEFEDNKSHFSQIINDKSWFSHIIVNRLWDWVDQNKPKMKEKYAD